MKEPKMNRRTFLKGSGGIILGLPVLEIMLNSHGALAAGAPLRFGVFFNGQSLGGDEDPRNYTIPTATGRNFPISVGLKPIETYNLRNYVSAVSGLAIGDLATLAGRDGDFHADSHYPQIMGVNSNTRKATADQLVANVIGTTNRFKSLHYQAPPYFYVDGYDFGERNLLAFNASGSGIQNETSPEKAYLALFSSTGASPELQLQLSKRRSVLDFLKGQREKLVNQVGVSDRQRLSNHFDQIRDLERSIASSGDCGLFANPGKDPARGTNYSDEFKRNRIFMDLIHAAIVCDSTRVVTHMITTAQGHMGVSKMHPELVNVTADTHDLGHIVGDVPSAPNGTPFYNIAPNFNPGSNRCYAMALAHSWNVDHFCYLLNKLRNTPEGAGNVLDSCAFTYIWEGGHGSAYNAGTDTKEIGSHSTVNMMVLVAGAAGGLKPGKHVRKSGEHPARVVLSAMKAASGLTKLGDVSGDVPELFTT